MQEERKRIRREFQRMLDNNFNELAVTMSYKIPNKKQFLQEVIQEFNNENDENDEIKYKIEIINDPRRVIIFEYKEKSLYKKMKDFLYYDIPINSTRSEYCIPVKRVLKLTQ